MLAELTETIIPKTNNFIGAKDLKSHEFILQSIGVVGKRLQIFCFKNESASICEWVCCDALDFALHVDHLCLRVER